MQLLGINKGVERTDLQPGESPDAANCFFHEGRMGVLGAREGKTFVNSTAHGNTVMGNPMLVSSSGSRYWQICKTDGTSGQEAAPQSTTPSSNPSESYHRQYVFGTPITQAEVWPGGANTTKQTLSVPIPAGVYDIFFPRDFAISLSFALSTSEGYFSVYVQFLDAGDNVVSNLDWTFLLDLAGDGLVVAADPYTFLKATLTLSGTATQILYGVNLFTADGGWSYSAGPFTGFTLRST